MNWQEIIYMLYSIDSDDRNFAYGIIIANFNILDEFIKFDIRNILNGFLENEMFMDDQEYLNIVNSLHLLEL